MPDKNEDESTSVRYPSDAGAQPAPSGEPCSLAFGQLRQGPQYLPGGTTPRTPTIGAGVGLATCGGTTPRNPPASRAPAPSTGEPPVDAMIARLDGLDGLPVEEHVAVFEDTHAGLRQVLSELDAAPEPPDAGSGRGSGAGR